MDHYIVAPYQYDETIFRRHRLAAYILEQDTDARIFWIMPKPSSVRRIVASSSIQIEQMEPKVYRIHVYNVWNLFNFGGILSRLATRGLRHHIQKNNNPKVLWYTHPSYPELSSIERWHSTIYDCSDLWSQAPKQETTWADKARIKLSMFRLKKSEIRITKQCKHIMCTSDYLAVRLQSLTGRKPVIIENGVDSDFFNTSEQVPDPFQHIAHPRIGFIGGIKLKIDFDLLIHMAITCPQINIVLVGLIPPNIKRLPEIEKLRKLVNVYFFDFVSLSEVPRYMKSLDVGLLPYKPITYNQAVSPLKLFEYLAVGIPVVGCGVPSTSKYQAEGVYYYANHAHDDFIEKCQLAIQESSDLKLQARRIELARQHIWTQKFEEILQISLHSS